MDLSDALEYLLILHCNNSCTNASQCCVIEHCFYFVAAVLNIIFILKM
jgi:hypothetical protein